MSKCQRFTEATHTTTAMQVDREHGVIRGVKVLGSRSKNGRRYTDAAMRDGLHHYENLVVNLDHQYDDRKNRKVQEGFGRLCNCEIRSDGIYADLHYLKSHPLAGAVAERAERFPDTFGLSHDAEGDLIKEGDELLITKIDRVHSVDLVAEPATTRSLFESEQRPVRKKIKEAVSAAKDSILSKLIEMEMEKDPAMVEMDYEVPAESMEAGPEDQVKMAFRSLVLSVLDDEALDVPGKLAKLKSLLKMEADAAGVVSGEAAKPAEETTTEAEGDVKPEEEKAAMESIRKEIDSLRRLIESRSLVEAVDSMLLANGASRASLNPKQKSLLDKAATIEQARELIESWDLTEASIHPRQIPTGRAAGTSTYDEERKSVSLKTSPQSYRS